jgi:conjugative transfer signal peptidase TraF
MSKPLTRGLFDSRVATLVSRLGTPVLTLTVTALASFGLCERGGVRVNLTGSLPIGLYRVSTAADANLVEFCPPEPFSHLSVLRQYRSPGNCPDGDNPLLKPVVARPGDVVVLSQSGLQVNGVLLRNTAPRPQDSKARPLPNYPFGIYRVNPGTIWVASCYHPLSFDSRYFGPISTTIVRHRLKPLLTL